MSVRQVEFPTDDILAAQALGDENLSSWMQRNVTTGPFRLAAMVPDSGEGENRAEWNQGSRGLPGGLLRSNRTLP